MKFHSVNNTSIRQIKSVNSKFFHFIVAASNVVQFRDIQITAPDDSPNTDGIHIGDSSSVSVTDSVISTGDDCVSIGPGSKDVEIVGVHCGPGHGFSVGSLGKYENEADVTGLSVRNCSMVGTENGVRIKTWASPLKSNAYNISFYDITMKDVQNPIIIDQEYCPTDSCSNKTGSNVHIKDVWFTKIRGTSASEVAVDLVCSPSQPCQNINLDDINLTYTEGQAKSICTNVKGQSKDVQSPRSCI